uniref:Uncharacterized protein orf99b n=2 Tax=Beta TaxID=3554 RepID=E6ZDW2_BETVM|nr:hypothetical protein LKY74_mgp086 [Beta vulgaris subsp. maritima]YP_004842120.1 hypothetical protein LKY79_mgp086 [Beta macrocarpa]CBJ23367.1 hypothetical protein [Beta vulgaris subsp. maritima]CBL51996.1 hypothetical protein [Beta vulgaris subsp. maritima]CBX24924.1 hypothetical protein [Beta macrocarpa]CBX33228.1 hypothetical protein [Beta vulgaris subsp. maritima]CBX33301.1 hypothetical protein [Beta vulgaris subsp. maritima]
MEDASSLCLGRSREPALGQKKLYGDKEVRITPRIDKRMNRLFFRRCAHSEFLCTDQKSTREKRIQYQDDFFLRKCSKYLRNVGISCPTENRLTDKRERD